MNLTEKIQAHVEQNGCKTFCSNTNNLDKFTTSELEILVNDGLVYDEELTKRKMLEAKL